MSKEPIGNFILGIDLGSASVGWALIGSGPDRQPSLVRLGARVFDAGMEGDMAMGREESRGQKRRQMRMQRRQIWRRAQRNRHVFGLLQKWNLLPAGDATTPQARQTLLTDFDNSILNSNWFRQVSKTPAAGDPQQVMPYLLRVAALDGPLEPHYLGRAFYHLSQRRGFLSNRKHTVAKEKDEDLGEIKKSIANIFSEMEGTGARTLGEFLSRVDTSEERIRKRWTARSMFLDEFEKMWTTQAAHWPEICTDERKQALQSAIFFQRKMWFPENLVGECELEKGERRAPRHLLVSQRFRLLDKVNNLAVATPDGQANSLTPEQRTTLINHLERNGDVTFAQVRKLLGISGKMRFNLEAGGEKKLIGNRTALEFRKVFGSRWDEFSEDERDRIVEYLWAFEKPEHLEEAARKKWKLEEAQAKQFAAISLEPDYMSLSRRAMVKTLPLLEKGLSFAEARRELYPVKWEAQAPASTLPPVQTAFRSIRNPAVVRSLTELRKVVNEIVRTHGKPSEIRIELARDLRNSRKQREEMWKASRENEKLRQNAMRKILDESPGHQSTGSDILKVRLWQECGGICPYTGKSIPMRALIGPESSFDIEHILPFSRSLDNSFVNLTLCDAEHNRNIKQRRTPSEAYGSNPDLYQAILDRVRNFKGRLAAEKLRRFLLTSEELESEFSDFSSRQLNDTRYASRLAADYLGLLYGGRVDGEKKLRVRTLAGRVTAFLRDEWKLNAILNDGETAQGGSVRKTRDDHRHHAVDALVAALTEDSTISMLSRAAERAPIEHRRRFGRIEDPWPGFQDSVREKIASLVVSHRVSKKVRGALHEETLYSAPIESKSYGEGKAKNKHRVEYRVRKPLSALTEKDVKSIADAAVRSAVLKRLEELGATDPRKAFAEGMPHPYLQTKDGRKIPIKKVRITKPTPISVLGAPGGESTVCDSRVQPSCGNYRGAG